MDACHACGVLVLPFSTAGCTISACAAVFQAPYLRFSDKQLRRLFYRLRESLERSGQVQRVRAFCRQTARFEPCLILSAGAAQQHSAAAAPQHSGQGQTGGGSLM